MASRGSCGSWISFLVLTVSLAGCSESHGRVDAGPLDDGGCGRLGGLECIVDCGGDAYQAPICSAGEWACPPGTQDPSTCPPTCAGPPPEGCVCDGTEWQCEPTMCPSDLNPWDPSDPSNAYTHDGATCTNDGGPCGGAMSCTCRDGLWQCAVAEPDPVCWCGREPNEGDPCSEEGAMCGECCPVAGGTGWPAMVCSGGHWGPAVCPFGCPVQIPECPANTAPLLGESCSVEGVTCGDPCCSDAITCAGGTWESGPEADCLTCWEWPCGDGMCHEGDYCRSACGPADGIEYFCDPLPDDCSSCDCIALTEGQSCEMIDGHPHVSDLGFCG